MFIHLADHFEHLPESEVGRLERQLRVILRHKGQRSSLAKSISGGYRRLGDPIRVLERVGAKDAFFRLLDSFGVLTIEQMTPEEAEGLTRNPFVIWPDERHCMVTAEAVELLSSHEYLRHSGYLFAHISSLPTKELNAWARWIGSSDRISPERERVRLYTHIAWLRYAGNAPDVETTGLNLTNVFLEDIIPDDSSNPHLSWYYRGILPFYEAMGQAEKSGQGGPDVGRLLSLLKAGKVVVRPESGGFGNPLRHRFLFTREGISLRPPVVACSLGELKEGLLF